MIFLINVINKQAVCLITTLQSLNLQFFFNLDKGMYILRQN